MIDLESRIRATLTREADATEIPPTPPFGRLDHFAHEQLECLTSTLADLDDLPAPAPRPRVSRRRRVLAAATMSFLVLGGGLSIAAAAGLRVLPSSVMQAFGWAPAPGAINADPATARRLLTITGPDGQPLQLWYADASDNGYCVALVGPVRGPSTPPPYPNYKGTPIPLFNGQRLANQAGGGCGAKDNSFGGEIITADIGDPGSTTNPPGPGFFIVNVPGAASVRVVFRDGTRTAPLPIAEQQTAGWISGIQFADDPQLVGYDAHGTVIGRVELSP